MAELGSVAVVVMVAIVGSGVDRFSVGTGVFGVGGSVCALNIPLIPPFRNGSARVGLGILDT